MGDVTLEHASGYCDDVTAVDDTNLGIDDGEFICLVDPSGCGKSTTVEMIAELTILSEGRMFTDDREVTNLPPEDRGVTVVFQNIILFPHMNIYDSISFELRLHNYDKEEIERRTEHAAETVQLQGMLGRTPGEISSGQRQRVAIAHAIVRDPGVSPMDEPLANPDAKPRVHTRTELQHLHERLDTTIIYVTHDQAEAMTMSDHIVVIDSGQFQQIDPSPVCYNGPVSLFVAGFIGSPSMNFLDGEVTVDGFSSTSIDVEFDPADLDIEPRIDVTMGVRPGDVYLVDEESLVSSPSHHIDAMTDVLEPMGDEILVYLRPSESAETDLEDTSGVANDQLLMSVTPDTSITEDEDVTTVLDRSRVHLFDTATGEAISHGIETPIRAGDTPGTEAENND